MKSLLIVAMMAGVTYAGGRMNTIDPNKWVLSEKGEVVGEYIGGESSTVENNIIIIRPPRAELIEAAKGVLPYLRPSDEPIPMSVTLEYREPLTPIQQLEKDITDIKERDAAIKRFRKALEQVN